MSRVNCLDCGTEVADRRAASAISSISGDCRFAPGCYFRNEIRT